MNDKIKRYLFQLSEAQGGKRIQEFKWINKYMYKVIQQSSELM